MIQISGLSNRVEGAVVSYLILYSETFCHFGP